LVQTPPARGSFSIIARHKGFGGGFSAFLPLRAREAQYKRGVSAPVYADYAKGEKRDWL
jgi:hypothetical protein